MMAAFAAAGAAFTACSSDDTLATQQTPEAPVVKGTPFKVSAFAEGTTRATRYNSDAWDGTNDETWVSNIKVWGKQPTSENLWMNNVVFERETYDGEWSPVRNNDGNIASLSWPTTNTGEETTFYAITDNAVGTTSGNPVTGVNPWMSTAGEFVYTMPTTTANIEWIDETYGANGNYKSDDATTLVDASKLNDLMVANATAKEADVSEGVLPLVFSHVLSGFTIKIKFLSESFEGEKATLKSVKVCGLRTAGTYTYDTGWGGLNSYTCYYKEFDTPIEMTAEAEDIESPTVETLVSAGEWLVIPQTTAPWDAKYLGNSAPASNVAYIAIRLVDDYTGDDLELFYPISTTFNAAKNRVITFDLGQFFDGYDRPSTTSTDAKHYYEPATVTPV